MLCVVSEGEISSGWLELDFFSSVLISIRTPGGKTVCVDWVLLLTAGKRGLAVFLLGTLLFFPMTKAANFVGRDVERWRDLWTGLSGGFDLGALTMNFLVAWCWSSALETAWSVFIGTGEGLLSRLLSGLAVTVKGPPYCSIPKYRSRLQKINLRFNST